MHAVGRLPTGQDQLLIGLHLLHEVTSPQAFQALADRGLRVLHPERTVATADHIVPTDDQRRPFADGLAEAMMGEIERNTRAHGIRFFGLGSDEQGIVHIIGPELGLTQPGMAIACGDSHTSTHGALGALAFGVGTSQIRDILATQTLSLARPRVRRIEVSGSLASGVTAKDLIIRIIADLGVNGGIGFAYEYGGPAIESLPMEARLTICNMSIEAGARAGYVNPDRVTCEYLRGRPFAPRGAEFDRAVDFWKSMASDPDASYDGRHDLDASSNRNFIGRRRGGRREDDGRLRWTPGRAFAGASRAGPSRSPGTTSTQTASSLPATSGRSLSSRWGRMPSPTSGSTRREGRRSTRSTTRDSRARRSSL